jgi:hypothetical protein
MNKDKKTFADAGKAVEEPMSNLRSNITRREFGRRASLVAAATISAPELLPAVAEIPAQPRVNLGEAESSGLSAAQLQNVDAKLENIVRKFGERLTQEQRSHLRKILSFNERMLASVREFPLQNGDAPASVLKISPYNESDKGKG